MILPYEKGAHPEEAHEVWKRDWKEPTRGERFPYAMPGKAVVEFGPFVSKGPFWRPAEGAVITSAIMVHDSGEDVPTGTEVAINGIHGTHFEYEGRQLTIIKREDILLAEMA